jgi:hypothetical protein
MTLRHAAIRTRLAEVEAQLQPEPGISPELERWRRTYVLLDAEARDHVRALLKDAVARERDGRPIDDSPWAECLHRALQLQRDEGADDLTAFTTAAREVHARSGLPLW